MNIFDIHSAVLADNRGFVRPFSLIADERSRGFVNRALVVFGRRVFRGNL